MTMTASLYARAGRDGELRTSKAGKPWAKVSAVAQVGKDRDGEPIDVWVSIVAFGSVAEDLARVEKGKMLSAFGRLELSRWTATDGSEREQWQLIADQILTAHTSRPKRRNGAAERHTQNAGAPFEDPIPF